MHLKWQPLCQGMNVLIFYWMVFISMAAQFIDWYWYHDQPSTFSESMHAWPDNLAICFVILWYCFRKNHRQKASITKLLHVHSTKEIKQHGFYALLLTPKCKTLLQNGKPKVADYHLDITSHWKCTVTTDSLHSRPQPNSKVKHFNLL